jgi:hypothetical protein
MFKARDFKFLEQVFRGRTAGIKNRENFTDDDMEAWKYTFSRPGTIITSLFGCASNGRV